MRPAASQQPEKPFQERQEERERKKARRPQEQRPSGGRSKPGRPGLLHEERVGAEGKPPSVEAARAEPGQTSPVPLRDRLSWERTDFRDAGRKLPEG